MVGVRVGGLGVGVGRRRGVCGAGRGGRWCGGWGCGGCEGGGRAGERGLNTPVVWREREFCEQPCTDFTLQFTAQLTECTTVIQQRELILHPTTQGINMDILITNRPWAVL